MESRKCYWCAKSVDKKYYFCSEKCRFEYNSAKGTNKERFDTDYIMTLPDKELQSLKSTYVLWFLLSGFVVQFTLHLLKSCYYFRGDTGNKYVQILQWLVGILFFFGIWFVSRKTFKPNLLFRLKFTYISALLGLEYGVAWLILSSFGLIATWQWYLLSAVSIIVTIGITYVANATHVITK